MPIRVKSRGNETAEQMLRRFKKMCEREGITKDLKKRQYYEKPSEIKRRESMRAPQRAFAIKAELAAGGSGSSGGSSSSGARGRPLAGRTGGGRTGGGRTGGGRTGGGRTGGGRPSAGRSGGGRPSGGR